MFFGEFKYSIDDKGRLRMPAKLKTSLGAEYVILKGTSKCLFVFTKQYFEQEFLNKLNSVPTFSAEGQKPIRMLLSSTYQAEEDVQGRFLLPTYLKEFAQISKGVVFIGVGNRIEIWSEENWSQYIGNNNNLDSLTELLSNYNV